jgi:hypothetical protein
MDHQHPPAVAAYLAAEGDAAAIAACFTPTGGVNDEGRTHVGSEAVAAWHADASTAFEYTSTVVDEERLGDQAYRLVKHLEGDFPGGVVDLDHLFALDGDRIAFLFITVRQGGTVTT